MAFRQNFYQKSYDIFSWNLWHTNCTVQTLKAAKSLTRQAFWRRIMTCGPWVKDPLLRVRCFKSLIWIMMKWTMSSEQHCTVLHCQVCIVPIPSVTPNRWRRRKPQSLHCNEGNWIDISPDIELTRMLLCVTAVCWPVRNFARMWSKHLVFSGQYTETVSLHVLSVPIRCANSPREPSNCSVFLISWWSEQSWIWDDSSSRTNSRSSRNPVHLKIYKFMQWMYGKITFQ